MADRYDYDRGYDRERSRDDYERDRGRTRDEERYGGGERGFAERAGDEVRSWFGDEEAARRRQRDETRDRSSYGRDYRGYPGGYGTERGYATGEDINRGGYSGGSGGYSGGYPGSTWSGSQRDLGREDWRQSYGPSETSRDWSSRESRSRDWSSARGGYAAPLAYSPYPTYPWTEPGPYTGRGPRGYQRSDDRIREDICDRLTRHGRIDATDVQIAVRNGEVTLDGIVDNREAKRLAEDVAESVDGVRDVTNHLKTSRGGWESESPGRESTATGATGTTSSATGASVIGTPGSPSTLGLSGTETTPASTTEKKR
jgi:osmotically-inducible protein OsmY